MSGYSQRNGCENGAAVFVNESVWIFGHMHMRGDTLNLDRKKGLKQLLLKKR